MKETHKLWAALIITGIIGGMVGIVLTEIMHTIQHLAYGYGSDGLYVSFREGVSQASPERRIGVMVFLWRGGRLGVVVAQTPRQAATEYQSRG